MACLCCPCCRLPEKEEKTPLIVDVNQVLSDEAWIAFKISLGFWHKKCIKRNNYAIEVPDNYFAFDQVGQPTFMPIDTTLSAICGDNRPTECENKLGNSDKENGNGVVNSPGKSEDTIHAKPDEGHQKEDVSCPKEAVSLDTTFINDTAEKQTYQFRFSKTRTSKVEVSYQKGFSVGGKANFSIGLPKSLANVSGGMTIESRFEVKDSKCKTFEESVTMDATSDISVGPKSKYVANVQLEERNIHTNFLLRILMSMPQGRAPIYIRRKSDNVVVYVFNVRNLEDIFLDGVNKFPCATKVVDGGKGQSSKVDFLVEGVIKGNLACDHTINLKSDETEDQKKSAKDKHFK